MVVFGSGGRPSDSRSRHTTAQEHKLKASQPKEKAIKANEVFKGVQMADSHLNACVGDNGGPYDLYDYAYGYFGAAAALAQEARKFNVPLDVLIYPTCLTFRHAIELSIKYLVTDLARLTQADDRYAPGHSLTANWSKARKLLILSKLKIAQEELAAMDTVVRCIEHIDPRGETFRYPENFKSEQLLKDWSLINIVVLDDWRRKIQDICHEWHGQLEAALEYRVDHW